MQLTKMSTSMISTKGPPEAVSARSHLRILCLESCAYQSELMACTSWGNVLVHSYLSAQINCTSSAFTKRAHDKNFEVSCTHPDLCPDVFQHRRFILVWLK